MKYLARDKLKAFAKLNLTNLHFRENTQLSKSEKVLSKAVINTKVTNSVSLVAPSINVTDSVSFWPDKDLFILNNPIHFLWKEEYDQRGRWPGNPPPREYILNDLGRSEMCYWSANINQERVFISLLTGHIILNATANKNQEGHWRLHVNNKNGFEFASNQLRTRIISKGRRIQHKGIFFSSGTNFRNVEANNPHWKSGHIVEYLIKITAHDFQEKTQQDKNSEESTFATEEKKLLYTLEQYVEAEFELEQQKARETPPFVYYTIESEPREIVYRQFFRVTLVEEDFKRCQELKPSLLEIEQPNNESIKVEVVDLSPSSNSTSIIIAIEKQVATDTIPKSGKLYIAALDILQRVRKQVITDLGKQESSNNWLVPLASQCYKYPSVSTVNLHFPESDRSPNESQRKAIEFGLGTPDCLSVLGPPGTGKTTVILQWVEHFVSQGKRILISSQNNKAVDNVLERLAENKKLTCIRLGSETKISSSIKPLLIDSCAQAIQEKLTENLESNLAQLSQNIQYLSLLPNLLQEYNTIFEQLTALQNNFNGLHEEIARGKITTQQVSSQIILITSQINKLLEKKERYSKLITKFQSENRPILKFISQELLARWFSWRKNVLNDKEPQAQANLIQQQQQLQQLNFRQQQLTNQLSILQQNIIEVQSKLQTAELFTKPVPTALVPEWPLHWFILGKGFQIESELGKIQQAIYYYKQLEQALLEWKNTICNQRQRSLYSLVLSLVDVVGATCIGINTKEEFADIQFDVVIIDESGQIQLHNLMVPLSRAPKAILVGDHKQLPPIVDEKLKTEVQERGVEIEMLNKSWFEILWSDLPKNRTIMLDTQFRCPAVISNFISKAFYDNEYYAGKGMEKKAPLFSFFNSPLVFLDTSNFPEAIRFEKKQQLSDREEIVGNSLETKLIIQVLAKALAEQPELGHSNEIGIIAPLANHVKEIQATLRKELSKGILERIDTPVTEVVATVDSFQGQERNLIVLTFTRSNAKGTIGFLKDWRRLNVAMTRAKRQLVMIGDFSTLTYPNRLSSDPSGPDYRFKQAMRELQTYIRENGQLLDAQLWSKNG